MGKVNTVNMRGTIFASAVFLLTWIIYAQIVPWIMQTWKITGDEPHYLLAAHSLVYDGDLDLKNNYLNGDHREFYSSGFLDPHVREGADGKWLLAHDIGLPIIIAPAYAWGGRLGVMRFFAAVGALLAAQIFLLGWEASGRWWSGALAWAAMAFTSPLALYVFQIYPEMIGGLLMLWAARQILGTPDWPDAQLGTGLRPLRPLKVFAVSLALAALPWLSGRYAPIMLLLLALLAWKRWPQRTQWIAPSAAACGSLAIYLTVNFALYGGPTPSATAAGSAVAAGFANVALPQIGRGLAAWLFDQQRGLLVFGPSLIISFFGLPHLWRLRGIDGPLLFAPFVLAWVLASAWGGFFIGWEISARFLIAAAPLLAGGAAAAFARIRSITFWPLAAALVTLGMISAALIMLSPFYAFHESPIRFYEEATHWQIRPYLPALGTRTIEAPPDGASEWRAAAAEGARYLVQGEIDELSMGWYGAFAQARVTGARDPNAVALAFDIFSSESGIPIMHHDVRAADADPATGAINLAMRFYNPYFDKWNFPLYLDIQVTGAADVQLSWVLFEPDPFETYKRVAAWAGGVIALTVWFALPFRKEESAPAAS